MTSSCDFISRAHEPNFSTLTLHRSSVFGCRSYMIICPIIRRTKGPKQIWPPFRIKPLVTDPDNGADRCDKSGASSSWTRHDLYRYRGPTIIDALVWISDNRPKLGSKSRDQVLFLYNDGFLVTQSERITVFQYAYSPNT